MRGIKEVIALVLLYRFDFELSNESKSDCFLKPGPNITPDFS